MALHHKTTRLQREPKNFLWNGLDPTRQLVFKIEEMLRRDLTIQLSIGASSLRSRRLVTSSGSGPWLL